MTEATIVCPNCKTEIKLTESLAAPLVESTRRDFEKRLAEKDAAVASKEHTLRAQQAALEKERATLDDRVAEKVREERGKIVVEAEKKAKLALQQDLDARAQELASLNTLLQERDVKLAAAQQAQVDLLRKQRELDDAKREMELNIERRIQEGLDATRSQARKEAEESLGLKLLESQQTIASMEKKINELKQKAEQGSQQLQGEAQELALESLLTARFPMDLISPVPKGEFGGDVLQTVTGPLGQPCGTIIWEFKNTKNWSDAWLKKLKDDQHAAKAEIAVIVSQALPKGVDTFDLVERVWVVHPRVVLPVALTLRHTLIEASLSRQASQGQQSKAEMVYDYLTGSRFRQRVQAIVEAFTGMEQDLAKEKKALMKQWAKREEQIERVIHATVGMYGDLQGIAGKTLQEIEGLDLLSIEDQTED
ncbi:MAG: DUF2130 domain-containing protein [Candidatus Hydrogenedentes bacterium]|nr:DUF2130 domain-containing protein [Candidatus Hydrogenedentota bacterium]